MCRGEREYVGDIDQRGFWFLVNKIHGKVRIIANPIMMDSGQLLKNIHDIVPFSKLFMPSQDESYDEEFSQFVENGIDELWRDSLV